MIAYFNGTYLPNEKVAISPDDRGFLFADGLYEVIRLYLGRPFRIAEHVARLERGARALRFPRTSFPELSAVFDELIRRNALHESDATIYVQVTRGAAPRTHSFPPKDTPPTIYVAPSYFRPLREELDSGVRAVLVPDQRWSRCDIKTVALLPNTLAHQQAQDVGAQEAIFVREGVALEGTHSNLFVVSGGTILTPPRTNHILPGITRQVVLELCADLSLGYREQSIYEADILTADEVMIVGTTVDISPVVAIGDRKISNGKPGAITRRLQAAFRAQTHADGA